jgi:uncharacterized protein YraI
MSLFSKTKYKSEWKGGLMVKFKKFFFVLLAMVMTFGMLNFAALAASSELGTVKCACLNVRKSDSTSSAIVGKLYSGGQVTIVGSASGWYNIDFNGGTAWVSSSYITLGDKAATVVKTAESLEGVKYIFGGDTPSGFDCSGYTMYCYSKVGVTLVHSAAMQATEGTAVSRSDLKPGDLVFFATDTGSRAVSHVGIYIGNNDVLQAETGSVEKVAIASLTNSYWSSAYVTARRFVS